MHPLHLPEIRSIFDYIVIELIQRSHGRQLRAWESTEGMQVKIVKTFGETVEGDYDNSRPDGSRQRISALEDYFKHDYDLEKVTSVRYEVDEELRRGVSRG